MDAMALDIAHRETVSRAMGSAAVDVMALLAELVGPWWLLRWVAAAEGQQGWPAAGRRGAPGHGGLRGEAVALWREIMHEDFVWYGVCAREGLVGRGGRARAPFAAKMDEMSRRASGKEARGGRRRMPGSLKAALAAATLADYDADGEASESDGSSGDARSADGQGNAQRSGCCHDGHLYLYLHMYQPQPPDHVCM